MYSSSRRRRRDNNNSDTHIYSKPVKYKKKKNVKTDSDNEETGYQNHPASVHVDLVEENPNVFTVDIENNC